MAAGVAPPPTQRLLIPAAEVHADSRSWLKVQAPPIRVGAVRCIAPLAIQQQVEMRSLNISITAAGWQDRTRLLFGSDTDPGTVVMPADASGLHPIHIIETTNEDSRLLAQEAEARASGNPELAEVLRRQRFERLRAALAEGRPTHAANMMGDRRYIAEDEVLGFVVAKCRVPLLLASKWRDVPLDQHACTAQAEATPYLTVTVDLNGEELEGWRERLIAARQYAQSLVRDEDGSKIMPSETPRRDPA